MQDKLQRAGERLFESAAVNLAVALYAVRIAGEEKRALVENRNVKRRADAEYFEVKISGPFVGRAGRDDDEVGRRCCRGARVAPTQRIRMMRARR
jgi:hypothetical protein